jgi:YHS domain-containing protein
MLLVGPAAPQSGSRKVGVIPRKGSNGAATSGDVPGERPLLAIGGIDPTSLAAGSPTAGQKSVTALFDSQVYRFTDEASRKKFQEDPYAYVPALSGWSPVAWLDRRELKPGGVLHSAVHEKRRYLLADATEKSAFTAHPDKYGAVDLPLGGASPVALVEEQKIAMGKTDQEIRFEGWRFRFTSAAEREKFLAEPAKYYPTLAGADPVAFAEGQVTMGDPKFASVYKNRLYILSSQENLDKFQGDPKPYSDLDVADAGVCPVTKKDENRMQLGKYSIGVIHLGRRVLFTSDERRKKFLADPLAYFPPEKKAAAGVP